MSKFITQPFAAWRVHMQIRRRLHELQFTPTEGGRLNAFKLTA